MLSRDDVQRRMESLEQACRRANVRLTHQRMEIFREVAQTGDHPDAETVFRRVRERIPMVSLDTVYRALWLLDDLHLITTLGTGRERTRFDANMHKHHHFVCTRCGLTRDFYSDALDELAIPDLVSAMGDVKTTQVEVQGICSGCLHETDREQPATEGEGTP